MVLDDVRKEDLIIFVNLLVLGGFKVARFRFGQ